MSETPAPSAFAVGCGRSDVTGEVVGCGMLGYGRHDQQTAGIQLRLRARAFVFTTGPQCILLVVVEIPLIFGGLCDEVLARLATTFGRRYTVANTLITATHTHCGPGGYAHHRVYNATTSGFRPATFEAIVTGIVEAVQRADADLAPAQVRLTQGRLTDASVNRSRVAFELNPEAERAYFPQAIDPLSTLVRIERDRELVGAISFFATHGTSMSNRNRLISSDNKGYAAYEWERLDSGVDYRDDAETTGPVFAFAQTNAGDMSPNLDLRPGTGPTVDETTNMRLIGARQARSARDLARQPAPMMPATLRVTHLIATLSDQRVAPKYSGSAQWEQTSQACAGASALAGASADGAGFPGFREGPNRMADALSRWVIARRHPGLWRSQRPKGIVFGLRKINEKLGIVAEQARFQLLQIGDLYLLAIPGEVTIVAGLRLRRVVAGVLGLDRQPGGEPGLDRVLVCGYSNGYLHYVTTPQEYDAQRYEGGSTLFGRWELPALQQIAEELATAMRDGRPAVAELMPPPRPPGLTRRPRQRRRRRFGANGMGRVPSALRRPRAEYRPGETVIVGFVTAHPNRDLHRGGSYLEVQRWTTDAVKSSGQWRRQADDGDLETTLRWRRERRIGRSQWVVSISWRIPLGTTSATYRIAYEPGSAGTGLSDEFEVRPTVGVS